MGFEEIRDKLLYLHKKRNLSKRKNRFTISEDKENQPVNRSVSNSSKQSSNKPHLRSACSIDSRDYEYSSYEDPYETYVAEKDPKNKAKYVAPSKNKKTTASYQGRRVVKFKEKSTYSVEQYGNIKKEKKPAPRKIMCVTEIMADISDTESGGDYDDTTSQEKVLKPAENVSCSDLKSVSDQPCLSVTSDNKSMLPPDKLSFMNDVRKRSQKRREKENESTSGGKISEALINKIYSKNAIKVPPFSKSKASNTNRDLASMIFKKFHDKKSISKIIQKTAKLQKTIDEKLETQKAVDENTGDAIRYCLMHRIKGLQRYRASNYVRKERQRGEIPKKQLKLRYQNPEVAKRKTRVFDMYNQRELDFVDANKLLRKRLAEFEFDNDIDSDEDEIAKSAYVRLKDLTVSLKEALNTGVMLENDPDDLAIKKHVGLPQDETI